MQTWTALFLLLAALLQADGYTILTRTTSVTQYATTVRLADCNETILFSCPNGSYVFDGRCTVKTMWLEKTQAKWFYTPEWLVLHEKPEGMAASCPPGALQNWTGYFVAYFDVYLESPNRWWCRYLSCHAWGVLEIKDLMEYLTPWPAASYLLTLHRRCRQSCQAYIIDPTATDADWLQWKSLRRSQRFRRLMLARGWRNKPSGKFICQPRDIFQGLCLTKTRPMQSIRLIFCICHTTMSAVALTSMRWP